MDNPVVSIVVPTSDRLKFLPMLFRYIGYQTFDHAKTETLIYDDGDESIKKDILQLGDPRLRYWRSERKKSIGNKRNFLNAMARGEFIVCFDDDDFYPPERVEHAVDMLKKSGKRIAGCSAIPIYFTDTGKFINSGFRDANHATAGTMAYTRGYAADHNFNENVKNAEERTFTNGFTEPMVQLDSKKTIIAINHGWNTFDKRVLIPQVPRVFDLDIEKVFVDPEAAEFYRGLK